MYHVFVKATKGGFIYLDCVNTYEEAIKVAGDQVHLIIEGRVIEE